MRKSSLRGFVFGHNHQSSGVLVDSVNEITKAVFYVLVGLFKIVGQAVQQCAIEIAMSGVHHKTCLFVDDNNVVIFVDDGQRDVFWGDVSLTRRIGKYDGNDVVGLDFVVLLDDFVIDKDIACFRGILDAIA